MRVSMCSRCTLYNVAHQTREVSNRTMLLHHSIRSQVERVVRADAYRIPFLKRDARFKYTTLPSSKMCAKRLACYRASSTSLKNRERGILLNAYPIAHTLSFRRWAKSARNNSAACSRHEGSTTELAFIVQLIAEGCVENALSAAMTGQRMHLPVSVESLVAFAANPIPLGAIKTRMRSHELSAKVRCTECVRHFPISSKPATRGKLKSTWLSCC